METGRNNKERERAVFNQREPLSSSYLPLVLSSLLQLKLSLFLLFGLFQVTEVLVGDVLSPPLIHLLR